MRKLFNIFLYVAVPVFTGFKFHVISIGRGNVAIIGNRTGLPAIWGRNTIREHWHDTEYLKRCEDEMEIIQGRPNEED